MAKASVFDLLAGQQALALKGTPDTWYLFNAKRKVVAGPTATKEGALRKFKGELPKGYKLFAVPPKTVVVSCGTASPSARPTSSSPSRPSTTSSSTTRANGVPEMTGADLKLSGTRQDFDPIRPADRAHAVHGQGREEVPETSHGGSPSAGSC